LSTSRRVSSSLQPPAESLLTAPERREDTVQSAPLSSRAKWTIGIIATGLIILLLLRIAGILAPFLWALVAAYLLSPVVNYVNQKLLVPRFWVVALIYLVFLSIVILVSRYIFPIFTAQVSYFADESPKLEGALIHLVGRYPLGIDLDRLVAEVITHLKSLTGNPSSAEKVLTSAVSTIVRIFIFLVSTFYLLWDGQRIRTAIERLIPLRYRPEMLRLAAQINTAWTQYIRGELLLFVIMGGASLIGLELLRVPGAIPLAFATGILELLPIVGPITAGGLAVSIAYFSGTNPFGWNQISYGLAVAGMYFVLREAEDYFVIPKVLGRAVRLHPLAVLFALAAGGVIAGPFGLLIAVPVAASLKIIAAYLYDKIVSETPQFIDVHAVPVDEQ
jgi:predicted PurR-regulated permease PerM